MRGPKGSWGEAGRTSTTNTLCPASSSWESSLTAMRGRRAAARASQAPPEAGGHVKGHGSGYGRQGHIPQTFQEAQQGVDLAVEDHAGRQAATGPEGRACQIEEQEVAPGKAQGAGQGRGQGGKPGDEFGDYQGGDTAPGKTDFALAHAAVRGNGYPAEEAEDGPPPAPPGAEPDTVCRQGGQGGQNQGLNCEYPVCHPLGSGQQQDGQGRQGRPRLLD